MEDSFRLGHANRQPLNHQHARRVKRLWSPLKKHRDDDETVYKRRKRQRQRERGKRKWQKAIWKKEKRVCIILARPLPRLTVMAIHLLPPK